MQFNKLEKALNSLYGRHQGIKTTQLFASGRICLLGEHIDYNGGEVITAAIDQGIRVIYRPTYNKILCLSSLQQEKELIINLEELIKFDASKDWGNYVLGIYKSFADKGEKLRGAEIVFDCDIPIGSGLSSSAALLVLNGVLLNHVHETGLSKFDIAKLCQQVENNFIGLQSGLMDPAAIALGKKNELLCLDCRDGNYNHLPIDMPNHTFLIFDTAKSRRLSDSAYNDRAEACKKALSEINNKKGKEESWRDLKLEDIRLLEDIVLQKRARHVISEMNRVENAKGLLKNHDLKGFGKLMSESHQSLKEDYEVSCTELDCFVDWANNNDKCLGAKMTGAGFGGCAIAIVDKASASDLIPEIESIYFEETGLKGKAFLSNAGNGVQEL